MIVAGLCGRIAFVQVARRLEVHQRDLGMQQRAVHPLALARALALQQGQQDADRRVDAGAAVGHGQARAQRSTAGMAVTDISPPMPWMIWSKPGRPA